MSPEQRLQIREKEKKALRAKLEDDTNPKGDSLHKRMISLVNMKSIIQHQIDDVGEAVKKKKGGCSTCRES